MNLSPSEQLSFCTVRITCELNTGESAVGTGFIFAYQHGEHSIPVIVTNKHVVKNVRKGVFQLTKADTNGNPRIGEVATIELDKFEQRWMLHSESEVDLCVMPIAPLFHVAAGQNERFFHRQFDEAMIPDGQAMSQLTAVEDILMIGYPIGIWDPTNNMPVFRRGITATHPNLDYRGQKVFMIDAACFPGSSGSPVLLYNLGMYPARDGGTIMGNRIKLLGILFAGPQQAIEGEIQVVPIPTKSRPISVSQIPINLGYVIKASRLLDFKPLLIQIAERGQ